MTVKHVSLDEYLETFKANLGQPSSLAHCVCCCTKRPNISRRMCDGCTEDYLLILELWAKIGQVFPDINEGTVGKDIRAGLNRLVELVNQSRKKG